MWRKLKRLGVAQLADGLVALPADARTREQMEWIVQDVNEAGGQATLWIARPGSPAQERDLVAAMTAARAEEYDALTAAAEAAGRGDERGRRRLAARLRAELHRIERRDFFPPPQRELAQAAVRALLAGTADDSVTDERVSR
jgi:hypothetical protein